MGATQTDNGSARGKWSFITVVILGAVLIIALIWSLSRAPNNPAPPDSVALGNETTTTLNSAVAQEEIERQDMEEQRIAPVIQAPVTTQPAVIPAKQNNDAVKLQKAKTKVNQLIVERMKQYVKDHPNQDNRKIEEQIKKREK